MSSQTTKEKLEQFMIVEFSEISKRYEKYTFKKSIAKFKRFRFCNTFFKSIFLDKLHLISNFIATAIAIDESDTMARQEKENSNSVNMSNISRFEALKLASNAFKTEINALEKYVMSEAHST